jgi:hypothetical protein
MSMQLHIIPNCMFKNNRNMWSVLARLLMALVFSLGACGSVSAYAIPAWKIVQMIQEKNLPVQNLRISRQTSLFDRIFPGGRVDIREELYFDSLKGFRAEMRTPSGNKILVDDGRATVTVLNDRIIAEGAFYGSLLRLFLSRQEQEDILQALKRMGINASLVSLGRMSDRVVIIIGAAAGDLSQPQLWVDKDLLLPVRFIGPDYLYRDGSYVVQDFSDQFQVNGALWFPKIVRAFVGSALVRTSVVLQAQTNTSMPQEFFSVSQIQASIPYGTKQDLKNVSPSSTSTLGPSSYPIPENQAEGPVDVDKLFNDFRSILKQPGEDTPLSP